MTLQEWKAQQGMGRGGPSAPPNPATASPPHEDDLTPGPLGEMRHATLGDDPTSAFEGELLRTAKEAGIGLLRSPLDLVKGIANTVVHPLDTLMGVGRTLAHPVDAVQELAKNPREAGSLLGQTLLAPKVPGAANAVLREGPSIAGRGMSAVGRGMEAAGTSKLATRGGTFGAMGELMTGHPGAAALTAIAPPALEYGGKGLQKLGGALDGLDLSLKENPFKRAPVMEAIDPEAETVRETVKTARDLKDGGMSAKQAGQRSGWPLGKSAEVPYQEEAATPNPDLFPYQKDSLQGLREAASVQKLADKFGARQRFADWSKDASANPDGAELDSRISGLEPSTLDELSRLSGRAQPDLRVEELLKKFGGRGQP